jgi:hypothetical protein
VARVGPTMRFGSGVACRGFGGAGLAVLVAVALTLVTPTNGLDDPDAHRFVPVHARFAHEHAPRPDRSGSETPRGGEAPTVVAAAWAGVGTAPVLASAGPSGAGRGLISADLHADPPLGLVRPLPAAAVGSDRRRLVQQRWAEVPTDPPR